MRRGTITKNHPRRIAVLGRACTHTPTPAGNRVQSLIRQQTHIWWCGLRAIKGNRQFTVLLLILLLQSVVVLQHDDAASEQEAYRQLRHDWESYALTERHANRSYVPNWRTDGRCGQQWPARDSPASICDPFGDQHCCSLWGWCGQSREHCNQGLVDPRNSTDSGEVLLTLLSHARRTVPEHICMTCTATALCQLTLTVALQPGASRLLRVMWQTLTRQPDAFHARREAAGAAFLPRHGRGSHAQPGAAHAILQTVCQGSRQLQRRQEVGSRQRTAISPPSHAQVALRGERAAGVTRARRLSQHVSLGYKDAVPDAHAQSKRRHGHVIHLDRRQQQHSQPDGGQAQSEHGSRQADGSLRAGSGQPEAHWSARQALTGGIRGRQKPKPGVPARRRWREAALQRWRGFGQGLQDGTQRDSRTAGGQTPPSQRAAGFAFGFEGADAVGECRVQSRASPDHLHDCESTCTCVHKGCRTFEA